MPVHTAIDPIPSGERRRRLPRRTALAMLAAALLLPACATRPDALASGQVVITDVTVVHPDRSAADAVVPHQTVVIARGRIQAIGPQAEVPLPPGARVLEGRGRWLVPGLIDSHVHFFQSGNLYTRPDVADFNKWRPYREENARNHQRLDETFKVWLASGVTGVVDAGGPLWNFEVRERARRSAAAPRVAVAGPLISTVANPKLDLDDPPIIRADSNERAIALARQQLERKPDYLKVWFLHRPGRDDLAAQTEMVAAVARTAHEAGVPLAVHATQLPVAKAALRAGADYLVHSVDDLPVDAEFLELLRARPQVLYCPTLYAQNGYDEMMSNRWKPTPEEQRRADPQVLAGMHDLGRIPPALIPDRIVKILAAAEPVKPPVQMQQNLRAVWAAGATVVMGTDAGNMGTLHGPSIHREMALMQDAGLPPLQVLRSATVNGAQALRMPGELGRIAVGYRADLLLLDGDPTVDVANLAKAAKVLKDGRVFDPEELMAGLRP